MLRPCLGLPAPRRTPLQRRGNVEQHDPGFRAFSRVPQSAAAPVSRRATSRTAAPARHGQLPGPADATRRPVRHARGVIQAPECIPRRQRFASASSLA